MALGVLVSLAGCAGPNARNAVLALDENPAVASKANAIVVIRLHLLPNKDAGRLIFEWKGNGSTPGSLPAWSISRDLPTLYFPFSSEGELIGYEYKPGWICGGRVEYGNRYFGDAKQLLSGNLTSSLCTLLQAGQVTYVGELTVERIDQSHYRFGLRSESGIEAQIRARFGQLIEGWEIVIRPLEVRH